MNNESGIRLQYSSLSHSKGPTQKNEYEHYDEQFHSYRKNNKSALQEWSLMESQLLSKKQYISENYPTTHPNSYSAKIKKFYETANYEVKSHDQIMLELREMRFIMHECNEYLNTKLNKYELVEIEPKGMAVVNKPDKQSELLLAQIETNHKHIQVQDKQIDQLKRKDKDLQERDYLIELQERVNTVGKQIHLKKKEKHNGNVVIHKLDNRLLQLRQNATEEEFKDIKILKYQIMHYFKKFHQNRQRMEDLDKNLDELREKDNNLNERYKEFAKHASEKFLLVAANPNLLNLKRNMDQLVMKVNQEKRKNDILLRSQHWKEERIEREMWMTEKQLHQFEIEIQEYVLKNLNLSKETDELIAEHNIPSSKIKNIASKFNQNLFTKEQSNKINMGPFSRLEKKYRNDQSLQGLNKSTEVEKKYQTIDDSSSPPITRKINDKNQEVTNEKGKDSPQKNDFRINLKPKMRIGQKKSQNNKTIDVGELQKNQEKSGHIEVSTHRPRFKKLLKHKDNRMKGPLSEEYMRSLEEKGKKNLNL